MGEIVLYHGDPNAPPQNQRTLVQKIIDIIAKYSIIERIKHIVKLKKDANNCIRREGENIPKYIERFCITAQRYLNVANSSQDGPGSQNFAVSLLTNAKLPAHTFSTIINSLVSASKNRERNEGVEIHVKEDRTKMIIHILSEMANRDGDNSEKSK